MEASPANRLPEIESLPDGFVEGSTEQPAASSNAKVGVGSLKKAGEGDVERSDGTASPPLVAALQLDSGLVSHKEGLSELTVEEVRGPKGPMLEEGDDAAPRSTPNSLLTSSTSTERETEGCLELHTSDANEKSQRETPCPKTKDTETKRKGVKRGVKQEKELLELTLKYHAALAERDAAIAVRTKLESLCRELQRQNKMLMEECQRVSTEGQNLRSDLSVKFNNVIKDVHTKLDEQKDECISQLKENDMLKNKLKHLADQYALSEQQFSQKVKQRTLELQIANLKIQQHEEKSVQEQSQMHLYMEQVKQLLETEKDLRLQLAADGEKFQQVQDTLAKSNEVFETFKQEMEKMTKLIRDLKKENMFLKSKCEKSDFSLIKLVEEREATKVQMEKLKNQKAKLESLCRSLQAERKQPVGNNSYGVTVPLNPASATEELQV